MKKKLNGRDKEKRKQYLQNNKTNKKDYDKQYNHNNKDKKKQYCEINKDKIKEYKKNKWIDKVVKKCLDDLIKQVEDLN
jgi:hypothetical protein